MGWIKVAGIWQHVLSPGRSGLTGISAAAGLSGATGMEQVWCAGPCCRERAGDCLRLCLAERCLGCDADGGGLFTICHLSGGWSCCHCMVVQWGWGTQLQPLAGCTAQGSSGPVLHSPCFYFCQKCPESPGQRRKQQFDWGQIGP